MNLTALLIWCFVIDTTAVQARTVDWTTELAADLALTLLTVAVERTAPDNARYQGGEFPTQTPDDRAARFIHGKPTGNTPTKKERFYRDASNVTVVTAAVLPLGLALSAKEPELFASRFMSITHTLLLSNFLVTSIKNGVRRPRPKARQDADTVARGDDALSFPSGHSSAAFAGATLVTTLFPVSPWWVKAGGFTVATATAWARIAGDKHFFSDVLTGGVIGPGSALLIDGLFQDDSSPIAPHLEANAIGLTYRF